MNKYQILAVLTLSCLSAGAWGLSTDRDKPAVVDADEVEIDFNTGERIYKGNVFVQQGTLRIKADRAIVSYKENRLQSATAYGKPATFRQRPDGKDHDVEGEGLRLELNEINNTLTLHKKAVLKQGSDVARGNIIVYDMSTDKLKIKGAHSQEGSGKPKGRSRVIIRPTVKP